MDCRTHGRNRLCDVELLLRLLLPRGPSERGGAPLTGSVWFSKCSVVGFHWVPGAVRPLYARHVPFADSRCPVGKKNLAAPRNCYGSRTMEHSTVVNEMAGYVHLGWEVGCVWGEFGAWETGRRGGGGALWVFDSFCNVERGGGVYVCVCYGVCMCRWQSRCDDK